MKVPVQLRNSATTSGDLTAINSNQRFNRLLPALGYVSHDFMNRSAADVRTLSAESLRAAKPNRILQGMEPYQYLSEIVNQTRAPPAQLSSV